MVKRLLVVGLIASVLVVIRAGEAFACSCAVPSPAGALEGSDAAFVGALVERPLLSMPFTEDAPYVFEVETWVKGDLGGELVVYAPNQGSACGFETPIGERVGVLLNVDADGKVRGNLCSTVNADLLLAGDRPLDIDGSGSPVFLIAGYHGPGRLMLLDASGGLLASVGGRDEALTGLALCPGSDLLVEMINDQLVLRSTTDPAEVRRLDLDRLPYEVGVPHIWCRDEAGETLWLATDTWTVEGGSMYRLLDAEDLDRPIVEGGYGWLELGNGYAVAGEGATGARMWRIDLEDGDRTLLHEIPVEPGDSEPSGRGWVDPSGERVLISQWRYRDDTGGTTSFLLYNLGSGELLWQSETMPTADGQGWVDDTGFLLASYPDMTGDRVDHLLIDTERHLISPIDELPGWQALRVGDNLAGVLAAQLRMTPMDGGEAVELRLLPSESHYLAAVLRSEATVTPTTSPAVLTVSVTANDDVEETRDFSVPVMAVTIVVLVLAIGAVWYRRRA